MDEARRVQIEILRSWTPAQRFAAAAKMIQLAVACRDARLRRQNPGVSEKELRRLRLEEVVGHPIVAVGNE